MVCVVSFDPELEVKENSVGDGRELMSWTEPQEAQSQVGNNATGWGGCTQETFINPRLRPDLSPWSPWPYSLLALWQCLIDKTEMTPGHSGIDRLVNRFIGKDRKDPEYSLAFLCKKGLQCYRNQRSLEGPMRHIRWCMMGVWIISCTTKYPILFNWSFFLQI